MKRIVASNIVLVLTASSVATHAAPQIPGFYGNVAPAGPAITTLPSLRSGSPDGVASITTDLSKNQMVINQNKPQATIDWNSFDIGAAATVAFSQKNDKGAPQQSWTALNRIYDQNPSRIYGRLSADGNIYLINTNGIIFGPGSQITAHSVLASSLAMTADDFTKGLLRFTADPGTSLGAVSNYGTISTDNGGSVFLIGPNVENYGSIDVPYGQIGLLAGNNVGLAPDPNLQSRTSSRWALVPTIDSDTSGTAVNRSSGRLTAAAGMVGMYGAAVQQDGIIRSVTAIKRNGEIELLARDRIVTGPGSSTASPIIDSTETVAVNTADQTARFTAGRIRLAGLTPAVPVKRIEHNGVIAAPAGEVDLVAGERVYLAAGSSIEADGVWNDKPAQDAAVVAQLTSVVLRDAQDQQNGTIKGATVTVDPHTGSNIGDISGALATREMTALDRSTTGGTINITVANGDLIARNGSLLSIAGGGTRYGTGTMESTRLLSGNSVYSLSTAPGTIAYDRVLGDYTHNSAKFGIVDRYKGVFYGGASGLKDYATNFTEGSNAGLLTLSAGSQVLDGAIRGGVERGVYQTLTAELADAYGQTKSSGLLEPTAGTLTIGTVFDPTFGLNNSTSNMITRQIVLTADTTPLSSGFDPVATPVDATRPTILSTRLINSAGLAAINLSANTSITTDRSAGIELRPGGVFSAVARRVEHNGRISAPSGTVKLFAADNATTYADTPDKEFDAAYGSKIYLASGSSISVAGERVDNLVNGSSQAPARLNGGKITVEDMTDNVSFIAGRGLAVNKGAVLDVSGGYVIDAGGKIKGGDAGSILLQGAALVANGDFRGFSLPGRKGGGITLQADNVEVSVATPFQLTRDFTATTPIPALSVNGGGESTAYLLVAGDRFAGTGMTNITLKSRNDLTIDSGVAMAPSQRKLQVPTAGGTSDQGGPAGNLYVTAGGQSGTDGTVPLSEVGASGMTLQAGQKLDGDNTNIVANAAARISVGANSLIRTAPGGTISIEGPGVDVAGTLEALAGKVSVKATNLDLNVLSGARISAAGYNRPDSTTVAKGVTTGYAPLAAGTVSLAANSGSLVLEERSIIDVSGSAPVTVASSSGTAQPVTTVAAGDPGTVNIGYMNSFTTAGLLKAGRSQQNLRGGTLAITDLGATKGLAITEKLVTGYLNSGFDNLTFQSAASIHLNGSMNLSVRRGLTLDAPQITGNGVDTVRISAPAIKLANSAADRPFATASAGQATLQLDSQWLDLEGDVALAGFSTADLSAGRDIRLADRLNSYQGNNRWSGRLATAGDLTLTADRIYPKMTFSQEVDNMGTLQTKSIPADFLISVGGKLTTFPSARPTSGLPVYSAGGSLTINAAGGFEHNGVMLAPLGTITINADPASAASSRVLLGQGSLLSTAGSTNVVYGFLDDNSSMRLSDKQNSLNTAGVAINGAPTKNITINGKELIVKEGAAIDVSAGGSLTAYSFQAGVEGSENPLTTPLTKQGRMVILPGNRYDMPGEAIYLNGGNGLPAGIYTVLPSSYAFLPGAYVITDIGVGKPGGGYQTTNGATVVSGYATIMGTDIRPAQLHYYSVRSATDVLKEGNFTKASLAAVDAGRITINPDTAILNGSLVAFPQSASGGGTLVFGGKSLTLQTDRAPFPPNFSFTDPLDQGLVGTLQVSGDALAGRGFREIDLGTASTERITLAPGSTLTAPVIAMTASSAITIGDGSRVRADRSQVMGPDGSFSPTGGTIAVTSGGSVSIGPSAELFAGSDLSLTAATLQLSGSLKGNQSSLHVVGTNLILGTDSATDALALGSGFFSSISGFSSIGLKSASDIRVKNDFNLAVSDTLTLDAPRIVADGTKAVTATFSGKRFELLNSGAVPASGAAAGGGTLRFSADSGTIGNGTVSLAGFSDYSFAVRNDLVFQGKGSLNTDNSLSISAARIMAGPYLLPTQPPSSQIAYQAANFRVDSGSGTLTLSNNGLAPAAGLPDRIGGSLSFQGRTVTSSADIELTAGRISLTATGSGLGEGVTLQNGAKVMATGYDYPAATDGKVEHEPGGVVTLRADNGVVAVAAGATVDVSAPGSGDAGNISLLAPVQGVNLVGKIKGNSSVQGRGGALTIDSNQIDFTGLAGKIQSGGFTNSVQLRARSGDVSIGNGLTLQAADVKLTADRGSVTLNGAIDASGARGGRVELNAGSNLTLNGTVNASGTTGKGGAVLLNVAAKDRSALPAEVNGSLTFAAGSGIDVSGPAGGGSVAFRAPQNDLSTDVNMNLNGTIRGASLVTAEAVKAHLYQSDLTINSILQNSLTASDVTPFSITSDRLLNGLGQIGWNAGSFYLLPGIELQSIGNIVFANDWDLTGVRTGSGVPGALTLRAAGNLTIARKLVDFPTPFASLPGLTGRTSWGVNLIAGSDLGSSDLTAVNRGTGTLTIGNATGTALVYTESAPVRFASGSDSSFLKGNASYYMINGDLSYTLGSYSGAITGTTGGSLSVNGGAVETATGDISLRVGGDLNLAVTAAAGSIRTTGYHAAVNGQSYTSYYSRYWEYAGGGDLRLDVAGKVTGQVNASAWDLITSLRTATSGNYWSASYAGRGVSKPTTGLAAMGGGSLYVRSGDDFMSQAGTFGNVDPGNLTIYAGGDLKGRFVVRGGEGVLHAGGTIADPTTGAGVVIESFGSKLSVIAQGNVTLGTVYNPTIAGKAAFWSPQYAPDARLFAQAVNGDLVITATNKYSTLGTSSQTWREQILPPSLFLTAGRDILVNNQISLAPSNSGNLQITAGRDIDGNYSFNGNNAKAIVAMSDADPEKFYGGDKTLSDSSFFFVNTHYNTNAQRNQSVSINAGRDLRNLQIFLPVKADVSAGRDIRDIHYVGQNLGNTDISRVWAGRDIYFSSATGSNQTQTGLEQGGAGAFMVQAGRNIDLGGSNGIQTYGNAFNLATLNPDKGSDLYVVAGSADRKDPASMTSLFDGDGTNGQKGLREYGTEYSELKAAGNAVAAQQRIDEARSQLIVPFYGTRSDSGVGIINMTSSQISTNSGKDAIYLLAKGDINVGKSALILDKQLAAKLQKNTGIYTAKGGMIDIFSGGDVNVNESRVMTFMGGDITVWSDRGNVNAGRGSRTAVSTDPPSLQLLPGTGGDTGMPPQYQVVFTPPAVGSGLRALTYAAKLGDTAPQAGDIYLFAPEGNIDAGEAGIAGGKITLGATQVLNSQNISFSAGSVGVPTSSGSSVSIGALSGAGGVTDSSRMIEQTSAGTAKDKALRTGTQVVDDFMSKFLDIKVLNFDTDTTDSKDDRDKEKKE
ncbi:filamentous hemagglutinin family protein [Geobacter argillaceus]|uniref:Filamentous hemagglutinin family protein n=2 Tax=Geobacter argillaceus TaxID=345631 RepID=A0A562VFK8_9BACT|nr:filamentous hemagglutinin family protein [Geobacter argillaceus]